MNKFLTWGGSMDMLGQLLRKADLFYRKFRRAQWVLNHGGVKMILAVDKTRRD